MSNTFETQLDNAISMVFDSIKGLSLVASFGVLIPFWSLVLIVDHLGRTKKNSRRVLKLLHQFFLIGLMINVTINTYYFTTKGVETLYGRMHLVAALCCLLFIIYLSFNFKASSDVRYGVMISYMGISLSLFTLPLEYFPPANKALSSFFLLGLAIYFFGLVIIGVSSKVEALRRRMRND